VDLRDGNVAFAQNRGNKSLSEGRYSCRLVRRRQRMVGPTTYRPAPSLLRRNRPRPTHNRHLANSALSAAICTAPVSRPIDASEAASQRHLFEAAPSMCRTDFQVPEFRHHVPTI
jgi:hypothetical protein